MQMFHADSFGVDGIDAGAEKYARVWREIVYERKKKPHTRML